MWSVYGSAGSINLLDPAACRAGELVAGPVGGGEVVWTSRCGTGGGGTGWLTPMVASGDLGGLARSAHVDRGDHFVEPQGTRKRSRVSREFFDLGNSK